MTKVDTTVRGPEAYGLARRVLDDMEGSNTIVNFGIAVNPV